MMKPILIKIVLVVAVLTLAIVIWEWRTHDDCPSLCRASSIARQAREVMATVEALRVQSDGSSTKDFKAVKRLVSYRSPYVERWSVEGDGAIVLIGFGEEFMLTLRPIQGGGWQCLGFPEKVLSNIGGFMEPGRISRCELYKR